MNRSYPISPASHAHVFDEGNYPAEHGTRLVAWITAAAMVLEIIAGLWFKSMALEADGWHMSTHAVAIGLSAFAYAAARRYAHDPRFAFGTWKMEILGGFASAIILLMVAALMVWGSAGRLMAPEVIQYREAMLVAVLGLLVNLVSALILGNTHSHAHGEHRHEHGNGHEHGHHNGDFNLKSAYTHVLADAATSLLAIVALAGGWLYGWWWLDPVMGLLGAVLVTLWARNILAATGKILLDREMDHPVVGGIRETIESQHPESESRVTDLHVWRVGKQAYSCAVGITTADPALTPQQVRRWLAMHEEIVHATIEIHHPER